MTIAPRGTGRKVVATPGTAVQVSSASVPCQFVRVTALESNQNVVVIGDSGVVAGADADANSDREGTPLMPNESHDFPVNNPNKLWLDSVIANDGVTWTAFD